MFKLVAFNALKRIPLYFKNPNVILDLVDFAFKTENLFFVAKFNVVAKIQSFWVELFEF